MKIGIIDFGCGNLFNITKALNKIDVKHGIVENQKDIRKYEKLILPGMGSILYAMKVLKKNNLDREIMSFNKYLNPILGICLGFQISLQKYEISKGKKIKCLSLIKGEVKILKDIKISLPNINWLKVKSKNKKNLIVNKEFYFAHSYYCDLNIDNKKTTYVEIDKKKIVSSYENKNLFLYQFHPELSGDEGLNLLKNFKKL
jgi:glutamine amidotransferase